jgi:uncharacterized membrane protein (DUF373 family)
MPATTDPTPAARTPPRTSNRKARALGVYRQLLDVIVAILVFVMVLALIGALFGLLMDFFAAANEFRGDMKSHNLSHGVVDALDQQLVIDVLSVFVLIELFRTFTDYLEFHRVRLRILAEVGIAFVLREIFIGLYDHHLQPLDLLALSALLAVLVATRVAAVVFHARDNTT